MFGLPLVNMWERLSDPFDVAAATIRGGRMAGMGDDSASVMTDSGGVRTGGRLKETIWSA